MRGRERKGTRGPVGRPAGFGNQLPKLPGKVSSSWPVLTDAGSGETPLPNLVRNDTSGSSSICIYTLPKTTPSGERSQTNRFVHRRRAHVKYKHKHSNTSPLHSPTRTQTSILASGTDCVYVPGRGEYKHTGLPSLNRCTLGGGGN